MSGHTRCLFPVWTFGSYFCIQCTEGHTKTPDVVVVNLQTVILSGRVEWHGLTPASGRAAEEWKRTNLFPLAGPVSTQQHKETHRHTQTNTRRHAGGVSHENSGHPLSFNVLNRQERGGTRGKAGGGTEKERILREGGVLRNDRLVQWQMITEGYKEIDCSSIVA